MDIWGKLAALLIIGYSMLGRPFAYIGIAPIKLFIGEIVMFAFIICKPRALMQRWFDALVLSTPLSAFGWSLLLFILYGIFEVIRGVMLDFPTFTAIQNIAFNYYPVFFFIGIFVAQTNRDFLIRIMRILAWISCVYGPLYLAVLQHVHVQLPGSEGVDLFIQAGGGSIILLAILCLERNPAKYWLPLTINTFLVLAMQIRSEWLGFSLALLVWGALGKKLGRVAIGAMMVAVLLAIGFVADFSIPSPAGRGGNVSTKEIIGRAIASADADAAAEYTPDARTYAGTVQWRKNWWKAIREAVAEEPSTMVFGLGYGFPLSGLVPYLKGLNVRTPHSIFYYTLGYTGWLGVSLFAALQLSLLRLLWYTYRRTGQPYGLAVWVSGMTAALLGNLLEAPFGGIPFYLILGLAAAEGIPAERQVAATSIHPDFLPEAWQFTTSVPK